MELERERQQLEDDKVHVERYKHLLLKQRDIMIGLTSRLNERDETIINLQCELDRVEQMKGDLNQKAVSRIKTLEYLLKQNGIDIPTNSQNQIFQNDEIDLMITGNESGSFED